MIINFNDLQLPFHRLAPGTILIDPDDIRYLKSIGEDMEYYWVNGKAGGIHKRLLMSCILTTRRTMTVHRMSQRLSSMTG